MQTLWMGLDIIGEMMTKAKKEVCRIAVTHLS